MKLCTYIDFSGKEIYYLRIGLKLSQRQLADFLNCSVTLICFLETGERKITPEMSRNLVELLKDKGNYNPEKDGSEYDFLSKCLKGIE